MGSLDVLEVKYLTHHRPYILRSFPEPLVYLLPHRSDLDGSLDPKALSLADINRPVSQAQTNKRSKCPSSIYFVLLHEHNLVDIFKTAFFELSYCKATNVAELPACGEIQNRYPFFRCFRFALPNNAVTSIKRIPLEKCIMFWLTAGRESTITAQSRSFECLAGVAVGSGHHKSVFWHHEFPSARKSSSVGEM